MLADLIRVHTFNVLVACVLQTLLVKYVTLCQSATAAERRFKKTSLVPEMPSWERRNRENGINNSSWAQSLARLLEKLLRLMKPNYMKIIIKCDGDEKQSEGYKEDVSSFPHFERTILKHEPHAFMLTIESFN